MGRTLIERRAVTATREHMRSIGGETRRLREDAGVSLRALASAAGLSPGFLSRVELGEAHPSVATLDRIAAALGADLQLRLYPNTGPHLRDRHQARMIEAFLRILHPRWRVSLEVPVRRPARGVIDAVLDAPPEPAIVTAEVESGLRRIEQHLRWAREKAESLPSADIWPMLAAAHAAPSIFRLLLLRSTRATRAIVHDQAALFDTAYPADHATLLRALTTGDAPWPGDGLLWVAVDGPAATVLERAPAGVRAPRST